MTSTLICNKTLQKLTLHQATSPFHSTPLSLECEKNIHALWYMTVSMPSRQHIHHVLSYATSYTIPRNLFTNPCFVTHYTLVNERVLPHPAADISPFARS